MTERNSSNNRYTPSHRSPRRHIAASVYHGQNDARARYEHRRHDMRQGYADPRERQAQIHEPESDVSEEQQTKRRTTVAVRQRDDVCKSRNLLKSSVRVAENAKSNAAAGLGMTMAAINAKAL